MNQNKTSDILVEWVEILGQKEIERIQNLEKELENTKTPEIKLKIKEELDKSNQKALKLIDVILGEISNEIH